MLLVKHFISFGVSAHPTYKDELNHQDVEIMDMDGLVSFTRLQSKSSKQMFTSQTALKTCRSSLTQDHPALI